MVKVIANLKRIPANKTLSVMLLCILVPNPLDTWGWSAEAHRTSALIAVSRLEGTNTATRVRALLDKLTLGPDREANIPFYVVVAQHSDATTFRNRGEFDKAPILLTSDLPFQSLGTPTVMLVRNRQIRAAWTGEQKIVEQQQIGFKQNREHWDRSSLMIYKRIWLGDLAF